MELTEACTNLLKADGQQIYILESMPHTYIQLDSTDLVATVKLVPITYKAFLHNS